MPSRRTHQDRRVGIDQIAIPKLSAQGANAGTPPVAEIDALERSWTARLAGLPPHKAAGRLKAGLGGPAPHDVVAMRHLAKLTGNAQQRERLLNRALERAPGYVQARLDLAITLFSQRRNAEALPHFRFLSRNAPENAVFRASLAVCHGHVGDYTQAIALYETCREQFAHDVTFLLNYAEAMRYDGRSREAASVLRGAVARAPGSGQRAAGSGQRAAGKRGGPWPTSRRKYLAPRTFKPYWRN
jgi:tetratricopeptide (TPR) repeat protein